MKSNRINPNIIGVQQNRKSIAGANKNKNNKSFASILDNKIQKNDKVTFSKHANSRLQQRNINLSDTEIEKISNAINKADEKGIKNSLIMMDEIALIANIKSRTIVTAVDSVKDKVFTNIDGVVSI